MGGMGLGQQLGQFRRRGGVAPVYDADAQDWFAAVEATGATFGLTPEAIDSNKSLINNQIFVGLPDDGVPLSSFVYLGLRVGPTTLAGAMVSIIGNPTFNGLVSGDYDRLRGIKYNSTIKNTQSNVPMNSLDQNNQAITAFFTTGAGVNGVIWGVGGPTVQGGINGADVGNTRGVVLNGNFVSWGATATTTGLFAVSRLSSTQYFRRYASTSETIVQASATPTDPRGISFGRYTDGTAPGTGRSAWESIGVGLTEAQINSIATRVSAVLAGLT